LDDHQALAERIRGIASFVAVYCDFTANLRDKLLTPWDRALRSRVLFVFRRRAVSVALSRDERAAIHNEETHLALARLRASVQESDAACQERGRDFNRVLGRWQAWRSGRAWLGAIEGLEADALQQWQELADTARAWDAQWTRMSNRLHEWMKSIEETLSLYDRLLSVQPPAEEVQARLPRSRREALPLCGAEEAVAWLECNWPPPGDRLESLFALWELGLSATQEKHIGV
jgi:hypothetical protein